MNKFERRANTDQESVISREYDSGNDQLAEVLAVLSKEKYRGYGIMGGAARAMAFELYNKNVRGQLPVRDIDLFLLDGVANLDLADDLARCFSRDDYEHGHGVQKIDDMLEYMNSRDFTMNQVAYIDGRLIANKNAINDIRRGIIRPCEDRIAYEDVWDDWSKDYETTHRVDYELSSRLAFKAILQKIVLERYIPNIRIETWLYNEEFRFDDWGDNSYDGFQFALALQKTFEYGAEVPERFINEIVYGGMFHGDLSGLVDDNGKIRQLADIMNDLNENILRYPFEFRNEAGEFYTSEVNDRELTQKMNLEDELMRQYDPNSLPKRQKMGR